MRGGWRFGMVASAIALLLVLAPAPTMAQDAAPATNTPATDTIGPRELQDFTLNGTVTRPAATAPPRTTPAPARTPTRMAIPPTTSPAGNPVARPRSEPSPAVATTLPAATALPEAITPAPSDGLATQPTFEPTPIAPDEPSASPSGGYALWLLAVLALAAGGSFLAWRRRQQPSYATAGRDSEFFEPTLPAAEPRLLEGAPSPQPALPQPEPEQRAPAPSGIVSTRLRPWLEIGFTPGRCVVQEQGATI
ncbi:MAG: hypothetical protein ABIW03_06785, partial [Sphingomicrobium sp.]